MRHFISMTVAFFISIAGENFPGNLRRGESAEWKFCGYPVPYGMFHYKANNRLSGISRSEGDPVFSFDPLFETIGKLTVKAMQTLHPHSIQRSFIAILFVLACNGNDHEFFAEPQGFGGRLKSAPGNNSFTL